MCYHTTKKPTFMFFIASFNVSVAPSLNKRESSSSFTIMITSSISSFEMNNLNLFPVLTASYPPTFDSKSFTTDDVAFVANLGISSLS